MKWFDIPDALVPRLRELQEKDLNQEIVKSEDAVMMFNGMGDAFWLTYDGRIFIYSFEDTEPREAETLAEAAMAVVVGAKIRKFPELLSILPSRPHDAQDCERCHQTGWFEIGGDVGPFVCGDCGGLGWK